MTKDGGAAFVTLPGKLSEPGNQVLVVDVAKRSEKARVIVGSHPFGIAAHPSGRWMLVTNRFSNFLSVIDVTSLSATKIPVPFYCDDIVVSKDGRVAYVANSWKDQVLVVDLTQRAGALSGRLRQLGFDRAAFVGTSKTTGTSGAGGEVQAILRGRCGTAHCHLYPSGGFVAGPDPERNFASAVAHSFAGAPDVSPIILAGVSTRYGGLADSTKGYHHAGGIVFDRPNIDEDLAVLRKWITDGHEGPGIPVGGGPRDMVLSPDGRNLYVANTKTLDVSVIDVKTLREVRRIATHSPVNDLIWANGRLVLATLGLGSGHPKQRDAGRESTDRNHAQAQFTILRDAKTGAPLPFAKQRPLGPYDYVDGTAQERFRDVSNDVVVLKPTAKAVTTYTAGDEFTRYTSDTFEAMHGDVKGDVPAALMKVVGAFPEQIARAGDRIYVSMSGSFQVQEWRLALAASPDQRLVPGRVFDTGLKPTGVAVAGTMLLVTDQLGDTISFIDLRPGDDKRPPVRLSVGSGEPFPATDYERGELVVQTSVFSIDGDQSCVHCHYANSGDGKKWSVTAVIGQSRTGSIHTGGSRQVPDLRALIHDEPFNVEGILRMDESVAVLSEHAPLEDFVGTTPAGDFSSVVASKEEAAKFKPSAATGTSPLGKPWKHAKARLVDLVKRRGQFFARVGKKYLGAAVGIRELQRLVGVYQGGEPRLLPNPENTDDPMIKRGRQLFESPEVGCAGCHPAPSFTDKVHPHNPNKSFAPLISSTPRDNVHTLVSPHRVDARKGFKRGWGTGDRGLIEREGQFVVPSLRGLWSRPPRLLHNGNAITVRETLCAPGHPALRPLRFERLQSVRPGKKERGLNERNGLPDTHGTTSHLSVWEIECLRRYILSIE